MAFGVLRRGACCLFPGRIFLAYRICTQMADMSSRCTREGLRWKQRWSRFHDKSSWQTLRCGTVGRHCGNTNCRRKLLHVSGHVLACFMFVSNLFGLRGRPVRDALRCQPQHADCCLCLLVSAWLRYSTFCCQAATAVCTSANAQSSLGTIIKWPKRD